MEPGLIAAGGTALAALTGFLTYRLTKREQKRNAGSELIDDALKLQRAAQESYEAAKAEMDALKEETTAVLEDLAELREIISKLQAELKHWRRIAMLAREEYLLEHRGVEPTWFENFPQK